MDLGRTQPLDTGLHPLAVWRIDHEKSQRWVARKVGLTQQRVSQIEQWRPAGRVTALLLSEMTGLGLELFLFPGRYLRALRQGDIEAGILPLSEA